MKSLGKKLLLTTMATGIVVSSIVGLTACGPKPQAQNKPSAKDVFSMAAVSSASFLGGNSNASAVGVAVPATERPSDISQATVDSLKEYLGMFNDMLANGGFKTDTTDPTPEELESIGSNVTYASKIKVTVAGEEYAIYYNETTKEGHDVDPDDTDVEIETTLEGVMIANGEKFQVSGKREVETEDDGQEVEIEFTTKNENGTVTVKQEIEGDEVSYGYTIYNEYGKELYEYEIEYEVEKDGTEMEVEIVDLTSGKKVKTEFEVKAIDETHLVVKHVSKADGNKVKTKINVEKLSDTEYKFVYDNGFSENVVLDKASGTPVA